MYGVRLFQCPVRIFDVLPCVGGRKNKQKMKNEQHKIQNASNQSEQR